MALHSVDRIDVHLLVRGGFDREDGVASRRLAPGVASRAVVGRGWFVGFVGIRSSHERKVYFGSSDG